VTENPPVLLQPAATTAATSTTTVEGSITLGIAGHTYTLSGTLGDHLIVEYHAAFEDAISLGTVSDIAQSIGDAVGFPALGGEIKTALSDLQALPPPIGSIGQLLATVTTRITDLEINTQTKTYGVGLALDFTQLPPGTPPPTLLGITLLSLGFKVTRVNTAATQ
jgi:hypothetical protein